MKDYYLKILAKVSKTRQHELVEECLTYHRANGTRELTAEQVKEFCTIKGLLT